MGRRTPHLLAKAGAWLKSRVPLWGQTANPYGVLASWWQPGSFADYQREAGNLWLNGVVLPGIAKKVNMISETSLVVQRLGIDGAWKIERSSAAQGVLSLIDNPNEDYDDDVLWSAIALSWEVSGNAYLVLDIARREGRPIGIQWLPHDRVKPISTDPARLCTAFRYTPRGGEEMIVERDRVIHLRNGIDPDAPALGLSNLAAEMRSICGDNWLASLMAAYANKGGMPTHLLSPKPELDRADLSIDQARAIATKLMTFQKDNAGGILPMPFAVDAIKLSFSPRDMAIGEMAKHPVTRICAALGIDPMVLGFESPSKTYSNYAEAIDAVGKQTVLPMLRKWSKQLGRVLLPLYFGDRWREYRFWFDTSAVSWLSDDTDFLHERVRNDFRTGLIDLYRAKEILGEEALPSDRGITYFDLMARGRPGLSVFSRRAQMILGMANRAEEARRVFEGV